MNCPDCGGPMWDNRAKKANGTYKPTRSDYSCKDKDGCGKGVWIDGKKGAGATNAGGVPNSNGHRANDSRPLGPLYNECLVFARAALQHHFGKDVAVMDILAGTATLFSQAAATGGVVRKAKERPKPAPPPPPPPPPQQPDDDEPPDDDLPF